MILFSHPACRGHDTGPGHPERPARLDAVLGALDHPDFAPLERRRAPAATETQLLLAHPGSHVEAILRTRPNEGQPVQLDADTVLSTGSAPAALHAVGAACAAVDAVMAGDARAAFAAVRPPGHHAEPERAMGFCLFGNAAIAVLHGRRRWAMKRIALVDFDVHHGNGSQAMLQSDPDLFYASSHQSPCYPGTGAADERGVADNVVNLPLAPGSGPREFRLGWSGTILPALDAFGPELLIVSAGFDAHRDDPLAALRLEADDFTWVTVQLLRIVDRHCQGRIVSILEGGYDLAALGACAAAHCRALMRTAAA